MNKASCKIVRLVLLVGIIGVLLPSTLLAYTVDGSTVTLTAADRTADNTVLIQGFLDDSTYTKIIIQPGTGNASWAVKPLFFSHANSEIHLNENVVLEALAGGYPNGGDCVLTATNLSNIMVTGDAGAKILMHKDEYANLAVAEWRNVLKFMSCSNVTVSGLILANSGGDGIYLGDASGTGYCSNVTITDVIVDGCARNGVSVISVDGLTITNSIFKNTQGQGNAASNGPWAGIDFEPNNSSERLQNIVIDNCEFINNGRTGVQISTAKLAGSTALVSLTVKNSKMQGNGLYGIRLSYLAASIDNSSLVAFQNCDIQDNKDFGVWIGSKSRDSGLLSFTDCYLKNNNLAGSDTAFFIYTFSNTTEIGGNIQLNNVVIEQPTNRAVPYSLRIRGRSDADIENVSGSIYASGGIVSTTYTSNINVSAGSTQSQAAWQLDETSGSTANDSNGVCDGTLQNSPIWLSGIIGGALELNGSDQYVTIPDDASLDIGTEDFSISMWFQRSASAVTNSRLLFKGASSDTSTGYAISGSNTSLGFVLSNGSSRKMAWATIPTLDQWHHLVATITRNQTIQIYLNGVLQSTKDISSWDVSDISNAKDMLLGAAGTNSLCWPGKIDDVKIYKRTLTQGEITELASSASALWRFDDGSGTSAVDSIGRSSGSLQNNPTWTTGEIGGALQLNGTDQYVSVANNSSDLNIGTEDFSISMWFQRSDSTVTNSRLLYKGASSNTDTGYAISGSNTSLGFVLSNGSSRKMAWATIPTLDQWHHLVVIATRDVNIQIYVNGELKDTVDISTWDVSDISNIKDVLIGAAGTNSLCWPGKVDDLRVYKRALTDDEITKLYVATPYYVYE
ncbi:MAG: right-handed parallel beta-helix repeat-containing protein [Victivallaceae bacterium]|nr:right-handed parallel beta-helix repeat-containing protein [Victivallaceae bacterium]